MVIYNLLCKKKHSFEGWFPSFEDFQKQADKKLISCPTCGTTKVEKMPHACAVHVKKEQAPRPGKDQATSAAPAVPPTAAEFKEMLHPRASLRQRKLRGRGSSLRLKKHNRFTKAKLKSAPSTAPRP